MLKQTKKSNQQITSQSDNFMKLPLHLTHTATEAIKRQQLDCTPKFKQVVNLRE